MTPRITEAARAYREKLYPGSAATLYETDPEFVELFANFAFDEVVNADGAGGDLDDRTRFLAILSALIGCQGVEAYKALAPAALEVGVTPVELKELVYQSMAYVGFGRMLPFLLAANEVLCERGESLPLPPQGTTTRESRRAAGNELQVELFGEGLRSAWERGPEDRRPVSAWLAGNCFGDWYTRGGLGLAERELATLVLLAAQGGCEPQLAAHALANLRAGNGRELLAGAVSQCVPYIGYPRVLNALACIDEAAERFAAEGEAGA